MKKKPTLKFSGSKEMLTREQMKSVVGGFGGRGRGDDCKYDTGCASRCSKDNYCSTCCVA